MPRKVIGQPPFAPVVLFDEARDFTTEDLFRIRSERSNGFSICIRYAYGPPNRGGYFFHILPIVDQNLAFELYDFERRLIAKFKPDDLVLLINHCTGRRFDEKSFKLCQTSLNFLRDVEQDV